MEFELHDRFLRDLNPDLHFKATSEGYRLTSAVFRDRRVGGGFYACSVDSERIVGDGADAARIARGHGAWGVGRTSLEAVREVGEGQVVHDPERGNRAHCTLTVRGARARALALACKITIEPTEPRWAAEFASQRDS